VSDDIVIFERGLWSHLHTDEHGEIFGVTLADGEQCPFCPPPDPNAPKVTVVAISREAGVITCVAKPKGER
jgi:hypothetical protein